MKLKNFYKSNYATLNEFRQTKTENALVVEMFSYHTKIFTRDKNHFLVVFTEFQKCDETTDKNSKSLNTYFISSCSGILGCSV